jgi:hypothetical protein
VKELEYSETVHPLFLYFKIACDSVRREVLYCCTINNTQTLIYASKAIGLEIHLEKTKYMLMSRQQNPGQYLDINNFRMCHVSNIWEQQ